MIREMPQCQLLEVYPWKKSHTYTRSHIFKVEAGLDVPVTGNLNLSGVCSKELDIRILEMSILEHSTTAEL